MRYETFKQYSERTGDSLSTVYRASRSGKLKTAKIKGVQHIIVEDENEIKEASFIHNDKVEKIDKQNFDKADKVYQEAEIINESSGMKYELEVFKNSIETIESMAIRIESAKDEMIDSLKQTIERQNENIDNLNSVIKTISNDNSELRTQIGIRETELKICENNQRQNDNEKDDKLEKMTKDNNSLQDKVNNLEEDLKNKDEKINKLEESLKQKDEQIKLLEAQLKDSDVNFWNRARKL